MSYKIHKPNCPAHCPKCESPEMRGPTYMPDNGRAEGLRYNCINCGFMFFVPSLDAAGPLEVLGPRADLSINKLFENYQASAGPPYKWQSI